MLAELRTAYILGSVSMYSCSFCVPPSRSTGEKEYLASYGARNRKFKHLWSHIFQNPATKSAPKEDTESGVALVPSRECTKELMFAKILVRWKRLEREQKNEISSGKKRRQTWFQCLCSRT